jgi:RNA polymerase sigma-70 factor (ECF subfamily)
MNVALAMSQLEAPLDRDSDRFLLFARGRDAAILERLLDEYADRAFAHADKMVGNKADAEDAVQEAFLQLVRSASDYDGTVPFAAWLGRLVHVAALRVLRSEKSRRRRANKVRAMTNVKPSAIDPDTIEIVRAIVAELPDKFRAPIDLHYFAGLSQEQIGAALGMTANAINVRMHRAREFMRQMLRRRGVTMSGVALAAAMTAIPASPAPAAVAECIAHLAHAVHSGAALPSTTVHLSIVTKGIIFMKTHLLLSIGSALVVAASVGVIAADNQPKPKNPPRAEIAGLPPVPEASEAYAGPVSPNYLDLDKTYQIRMPGSMTSVPDVRGKGKTYYVSLEGSDQNNGSDEARPARSFQKILDQMGPGDTLMIGAGTYPGSDPLNQMKWPGGRKGQPGAMMTFMAKPGSRVVFSDTHYSFGSFVALDGLEFEWSGTELSHHAIVQNCTFRHGPKGNSGGNPRMLGIGYGVQYEAQDETLASNSIRNNAFLDGRVSRQSTNDYRCAYLYFIYNNKDGTKSRKNIAEHNYFADFNNLGEDGVQPKDLPIQQTYAIMWKHGSCGDTVRYNYFHRFRTAAICHYGAALDENGWGGENIVHHNVFDDVDTAIDGYLWYAGDWQVHNNTVIDTGYFFSVRSKWSAMPRGEGKTLGWLYNNLVLQRSPGGPRFVFHAQNRGPSPGKAPTETYVRGAAFFDCNAFDARNPSLKHCMGTSIQDLHGMPYPELHWNQRSVLIEPSNEVIDLDRGDYRLKPGAKSATAGLGALDPRFPKYCGAYDPEIKAATKAATKTTTKKRAR